MSSFFQIRPRFVYSIGLSETDDLGCFFIFKVFVVDDNISIEEKTQNIIFFMKSLNTFVI